MEFQHELIIPDEGLPFKIFLFEGGNGQYVREKHWHTSIEIFAVLEGRLTFYLNEEKHPLEAGKLILINSNEIHSIHAPEANKTAVLQIPLKQFENYFTAQRYIRFSPSREDADAELLGLLEKLYYTYEQKAAGWEFQMMSAYYQVLYLLVKTYRITEAAEKDIRDSRHLDTLSRITSYMREHYREDLKLNDVAEVFGYSPAYLSRMFQKYAKINFKAYLQEIRLTYACRELMNTDHTISRVALDNGFCSSRAFASEYRKKYGCLPSEAKIEKRQK